MWSALCPAPLAPRLSLAVLSLVLFVTFLDNTIVATALADIQVGLHAGVSALQWVVSAYALTFAALMLTFGTLSDHLGRRRVMVVRAGHLHGRVGRRARWPPAAGCSSRPG